MATADDTATDMATAAARPSEEAKAFETESRTTFQGRPSIPHSSPAEPTALAAGFLGAKLQHRCLGKVQG